MTLGSESLLKVVFSVDTGDGPLPKLKKESIWGEPKGKRKAVLRNVPFFACNVALGDLIEFKTESNEHVFICVREPSSNSTVHCFCFNPPLLAIVKTALLTVGCTIEIGPIPEYLAINVPSVQAANCIKALMIEHAASEQLCFQVSCSRHPDVLEEKFEDDSA
ncbi:DUF4265 domain-containing protein [Iodobacter ciconiae]|uniref:DUF4265 domain-containing protein n=1 Tax=Iodobacter ciconiae TaxID=2496266 RepID=A0A3S8ZPS1_9NEIS|nr:DUF4265 domain-containing protein [Iodobacter ciconiae]AZN35465.1 DUF4265 domain-containing protein [Iodobacter ciconiae]